MENKDKLIRELLLSDNHEAIIALFDELRNTGNDNILNLFADVYKDVASSETQRLISQFFCDLQGQQSAETVVGLLRSTTHKPTLKMLAASCWQSRLNYSSHFELFIDLVIHEEFEISFEAFTLIESYEEPIAESRIKDLIAYVNKNMGNCKAENLVFAGDLVKIIEGFNS